MSFENIKPVTTPRVSLKFVLNGRKKSVFVTVTITKQAVRYQNINLYFKPRTELLHVFAMIQQWPTHEERVSRDALRPQETPHFM